ncbi:glycosyl transferase [Novosphingobium guangzhouense]|uniref:Glycosyl transferase n=1 Tax=Novosphingobium guangzhouense TaxID=1850347 RepID=A0A2K2FZP4_9SPHN|nr:glycosyl transferase [Novosphingobium guangzhouense]PNU04243.1 glycosyl transferase [Novosphingobium guangzhouense]
MSLNNASSNARIHVLAIGGAHQFGHFLPVACELERRHPGQVRLFVSTEAEAAAAVDFARGGHLPQVEVMRLPAAAVLLPATLHKAARLTIWAQRLRDAAVILCAERTSTMLKRLPGDCPPILHIPHGAGDRAVGFEPRFRLFDHVMLAGRKDRDRLVEAGFVTAQDCTVTGPVKLATVLAGALAKPPLFDNGRPTILYNPHFSKKLSSIEAFGRRLVAAVVADGRYNLVVAPHVRLAKRWSAAKRREWEALAVAGQVIVDLGSPRCNDMTYTLGADLYVGDVSSQVYEFLARPRPCLFVDAKGVAWQDSEDYAMWHFGEVIGADADPVAAIERAFATHGAYVQWQRERMAYTIDGIAWLADGTPSFGAHCPVREAADKVEEFAGLKPRALAAVA